MRECGLQKMYQSLSMQTSLLGDLSVNRLPLKIDNRNLVKKEESVLYDLKRALNFWWIFRKAIAINLRVKKKNNEKFEKKKSCTRECGQDKKSINYSLCVLL